MALTRHSGNKTIQLETFKVLETLYGFVLNTSHQLETFKVLETLKVFS